jgi:hypothetical protein
MTHEEVVGVLADRRRWTHGGRRMGVVWGDWRGNWNGRGVVIVEVGVIVIEMVGRGWT